MNSIYHLFWMPLKTSVDSIVCVYSLIILCQFFFNWAIQTNQSFYEAIQNVLCFIGRRTLTLPLYLFLVSYPEIENKVYIKYISDSGVVSYLFVFLIIELVFYLVHWASHKNPILWAFHEVHHTSKELNFSTTLRVSWFDAFVVSAAFFPLYCLFSWLGIKFQMVTAVLMVGRFYAFWSHSGYNIQNKYVSKLLITPKDHSLHHEMGRGRQNSNYGIVLSIYDHMFKTYSDVPSIRVYGVKENWGNTNFIKLQLMPILNFYNRMLKMKTLKGKLCYFFYYSAPTKEVVKEPEEIFPLGECNLERGA